MENESSLICPECGANIDVNSILYQQIRSKTQKEFNEKISKKEKALELEKQKFNEEKKQLESEKEKIQQRIDQAANEKLKTEKTELAKQLKKELENENAEQINSLREEIQAKSEKLKEHNKLVSENEKLKREKTDLKYEIEAEAEKKITDGLREGREKYQKQLDEMNQLKISEKEKVIDDLKKQLSEAQRKAEQGLTQRQGEVQEQAIEEYLRAKFPQDSITEVKKGAKGADCLQTINTARNQNCGTIYYESKRTKSFQENWIEKFKSDIREQGASLGVLVTEVLPKNMERFGQKDGIWICTFEEFKGLCFALRDSIIQVHSAMLSQVNKGGKMEMLYTFLTSNEFKLQIEAIVEGFTQMETDLATEKRAMERIWKQREKQIQKVLLNTNHMYSSIKGIAGNAVASIEQLELPNG